MNIGTGAGGNGLDNMEPPVVIGEDGDEQKKDGIDEDIIAVAIQE